MHKKKGNLRESEAEEVEARLTVGHSSSMLEETNCWQWETGPINHLAAHTHTGHTFIHTSEQKTHRSFQELLFLDLLS